MQLIYADPQPALDDILSKDKSFVEMKMIFHVDSWGVQKAMHSTADKM